MEQNTDLGHDVGGPNSGGMWRRGVWILLCSVALCLELQKEFVHPSLTGLLLTIVLCAGIASFAFPMQIRRVFMTLFGKIEYTDEISPVVEGRIRSRYRAQIDELTSMRFHVAFFKGQTFPILRLLAVFPAIVLAVMFLNREVVTFYRGGRFLVGHIVLKDEIETTFVQILRLGVLFATRFEDDRILISCNYGYDNLKWRNYTRHAYRGQSIAETWTKHQQSVKTMEIQDAPVDRNLSFEKFVNMVG